MSLHTEDRGNWLIDSNEEGFYIARLEDGGRGPILDATPPGWVKKDSETDIEDGYVTVTLHKGDDAKRQDFRASVESVEAGVPVWELGFTTWQPGTKSAPEGRLTSTAAFDQPE